MNELQAKAERVEREILQMKASIRSGNALTLIVGLIVLGALGYFFYYGYTEISSVLEPKTLVASGLTIMNDNLPEVSKTLQTEIVKNAPKWAEDSSKELVKRIPELREHLEKAVIAMAEEQLKKGTALTRDEFAKFVKDNRAMLKDGFAQLKKDDVEAKKFLGQLVSVMQDQLGRDFKEESDSMFLALAEVNSRASELKDSKFLKGGDFHLKEALALAKRAQLVAADPKMHITTPK